jgi:hypothetical protein
VHTPEVKASVGRSATCVASCRAATACLVLTALARA